MDPTIALATALDNLACINIAPTSPEQSLDRLKAIDALRNLADWLDGGGFAPKVIPSLDNAGVYCVGSPD